WLLQLSLPSHLRHFHGDDADRTDGALARRITFDADCGRRASGRWDARLSAGCAWRERIQTRLLCRILQRRLTQARVGGRRGAHRALWIPVRGLTALVPAA